MTDKKEAFVPKEDRPDPEITLERPVSELTVRDLVEILHGSAHRPIFKVQKDRIKEDTDGYYAALDVRKFTATKAAEYPKFLETKPIADLFKSYNDTVNLGKLKHEVDQHQFYPGPGFGPGPVEALTQLVTGLTETVGQLADQVSQLAARERKQ